MKFADASILVAVLIREDGYKELAARLEAAKPILISPVAKWEATVKLARVTNPELASKQIDELLTNLDARMISMDERIYDLAFDAWTRYGKGVTWPNSTWVIASPMAVPRPTKSHFSLSATIFHGPTSR